MKNFLKALRKIFTPSLPTLPKSYEKRLINLVCELNKQSKCGSALNYILRVLDYDPQNHEAISFAGLITYGCLQHNSQCNEPITQAQISDQRLDSIFNECYICHSQWIPIGCGLDC